MRIVFVSYMHPHVAPGGAQQIAYELYQAALARGHEAYLIAALEIEHEAEYGKPGAPIVPAPGLPGQYFFFPQYYEFPHLSVCDWRSLKFLKELIALLDPDVVHFHHYHRIGVESFRAARLAAPHAHISLTFHEMMAICMADGQMVKKKSRDLCHRATPLDCHGCFDHLRPEFFVLRAARLRAALEECDAFVFPSEFVANRYREWGLSSHKTHVIANGQQHPAVEVARSRHSAKVNRFGFFGQFIDNKGIDVVLEALKILASDDRIPHGDLEFIINGGNRHYASGPYLEKVDSLEEELAERSQGRIKVVEAGKYNREQLADRMMAVDWVIVPSTWWEVFGLVVSEAWMFGRPVIVSDIAGLGERVVDGKNGFTFPARSAEALADVIEKLAGNEREWVRAHKGISPDWSDLDMFDTYFELWNRERTQPTLSGVAKRETHHPRP